MQSDWYFTVLSGLLISDLLGKSTRPTLILMIFTCSHSNSRDIGMAVGWLELLGGVDFHTTLIGWLARTCAALIFRSPPRPREHEPTERSLHQQDPTTPLHTSLLSPLSCFFSDLNLPSTTCKLPIHKPHTSPPVNMREIVSLSAPRWHLQTFRRDTALPRP